MSGKACGTHTLVIIWAVRALVYLYIQEQYERFTNTDILTLK